MPRPPALAPFEGSREQLESVAVRRPHDGEVSVVESRDRLDPESLRNGDDRGVDEAEAEVAVGLDQLSATGPVRACQIHHVEFAIGDRGDERRLGIEPESRLEHPGALDSNRSGDCDVGPVIQ